MLAMARPTMPDDESIRIVQSNGEQWRSNRQHDILKRRKSCGAAYAAVQAESGLGVSRRTFDVALLRGFD